MVLVWLVILLRLGPQDMNYGIHRKSVEPITGLSIQKMVLIRYGLRNSLPSLLLYGHPKNCHDINTFLGPCKLILFFFWNSRRKQMGFLYFIYCFINCCFRNSILGTKIETLGFQIIEFSMRIHSIDIHWYCLCNFTAF